MSRKPSSWGPHHSNSLLLGAIAPDVGNKIWDTDSVTDAVVGASSDILDTSTFVDWESWADTPGISQSSEWEVPHNMTEIAWFPGFYVEQTESWFWVIKIVDWKVCDMTHKSHPEPLVFSKSWIAVSHCSQGLKFSQIHDDKITYDISDRELSQIKQPKWMQEKGVFILKDNDKRGITFFNWDKLIDISEFWFDYIKWMREEWYFVVKRGIKTALAKLDNGSIVFTKFKMGGINKKQTTDFGGDTHGYRLWRLGRHKPLDTFF